MTPNKIIIIGASGHARVCLDILLANKKEIIGFCDDDPMLKGLLLNGYPILGDTIEVISRYGGGKIDFFVAIGNNIHRKNIVKNLINHNISVKINAIHPSAIVSPRVSIGVGNFIAPGVIINSNTVINNYTIVNTGTTIDHDNLIHNFSQISPGCNLCGHVTVEEQAFLGTGTTVIPNKTIGSHAIIGAGAVVIQDIPSFSTAVGVPARVIKNNKGRQT
jgi:sugar O-acyltransferase (sialic acid O-acetyltransferase NeuD family)